MDKDERTTHFQGSAKLLWDALYTAGNAEGIFLGYRREFLERLMEPIIAQFDYDLVIHVLTKSPAYVLIKYEDGEMEKIPDLTEWPTTTE